MTFCWRHAARFEFFDKLLLAPDKLAGEFCPCFPGSEELSLASQWFAPISHRSSIQAAIASSASKYAAVASVTALGRPRPSACHLRQPLIAHCKIPGHSSRNLFARSMSRSSGGMVTENGTRWNRRRIASSTLRNPGLWLPAMTSLNCG